MCFYIKKIKKLLNCKNNYFFLFLITNQCQNELSISTLLNQAHYNLWCNFILCKQASVKFTHVCRRDTSKLRRLYSSHILWWKCKEIESPDDSKIKLKSVIVQIILQNS